MRLRRVTWGVRGGTDSLEVLCGERGDRLFHRVHALTAYLEHVAEGGVCFGAERDWGPCVCARSAADLGGCHQYAWLLGLRSERGILFVRVSCGSVGLSAAAIPHVEYPFATGDRVDVMFENHMPDRAVIEVEVEGEHEEFRRAKIIY